VTRSPAAQRNFSTEAAIRLVEAPVRRMAWHVRTSGIAARVGVGIAAGGVLLGAVASIVWLASSLVAGL